MNRTILAALVGLVCARATLAENGVLVEHVSAGAEPAVVVTVVKVALTQRKWTVTAVDVNSVDAEIDHANTKAKIRIVFSQGRVSYEGSAVTTYRTGPQQSPLERTGGVPERWVSHLRRDVSMALAARGLDSDLNVFSR